MRPTSYRFYQKLILTQLLSFLILSGCQQDVYDPDYRTPMPSEFKDLQASPNFDWAMTSNVRLDVNVIDEYQGQYYYEVSVYDANPFFNEKAQLLSKGLAKEGKTFNTLLTIPKDIEELYICQSMKMKDGSVRRLVKILPVESNNLNCDFTSSGYTVNSDEAVQSIARASDKKEDFTVPINAIEIKGDNFRLQAKGNYIIKEGATFDGTLQWDWCQDVNIYILGTFAPRNGQEMNGKCTVYISKNGTYKASKLDINSNSRIYNYGKIDIDHIYITGGNCIIDNYNELTTNKLEATDNAKINNYQTCNATNTSLDGNSKLYNEGQISTSNEFKMLGGAYLENNCFINTKSFRVEGNKVDIGREAMIICETSYTHSAKISLRPNAIFEVTNTARFADGNTIQAIENDNGPITALVKFNKIENCGGWKELTIGNKIQIFYRQSSTDDKNRIDLTKAIIAESEDATIQIPASGCNGNGNNIPSKDPEGSGFPIIVSPDNSYTFLMEDNWPLYGDYDMNDLVMDIKLEYELEDNDYIEELEITATLRAIGASKPLAAAIQLDKVKRSDVKKAEDDADDEEGYIRWTVDGSVFDCSNGLENGQEFAVIPFFDDAYKLLGTDRKEPTNTIQSKNSMGEKKFKIEIEFAQNRVKIEDININNLNFFIVTDGNKVARKEVHLRGYESTSKGTRRFFNSHSDNYDIAPYLSKDNLIWGLMIPANKKSPFKYPLEYTNIKEAYPMFEEWVTSQGTTNKDWYKQENAKGSLIYNK